MYSIIGSHLILALAICAGVADSVIRDALVDIWQNYQRFVLVLYISRIMAAAGGGVSILGPTVLCVLGP